MPCPCFVPDGPLAHDIAPRPARAPLADVHRGSCSTGATVDLAAMIETCNFGYARGRCAAFPADMTCDAFRFSAPRDCFGSVVEITWIAEQDYSPVRYGKLRYSPEQRAFLDSLDDSVLLQQALAFATSYVRA
jgi:hypothetical protein